MSYKSEMEEAGESIGAPMKYFFDVSFKIKSGFGSF